MTKKLIVLTAVVTLTVGMAGCKCCDWFRRGSVIPTTTAMPVMGDPCCPVDACGSCDPCASGVSCDPCAPSGCTVSGGCAVPGTYAAPGMYTTPPTDVYPGPGPVTTPSP